MTMFNDRERGEEAKFVHYEEMAFRIAARRNRLLGDWAADRIGLSGKEKDDYIRDVVQADFAEPGEDDVIGKVLADMLSAGVAIDELELRRICRAKQSEAEREIIGAG